MYISYAIYPILTPLEVKLTSADGMESKAKIKIDNTPPEIKIDKIEGNVIKGVINDVSEIDQASLPKEFTDGDKRISITYSNNSNPSNYRLDSNNTVNFKSLIFEATIYGFDSTTDDIEDYKYSVGSKIEDETKDKLGNKAPKISFGLSMEQSDAEEEDNSSGFNTKGSPPNTVNKHTISEETFKALEKLSTYQGTADQIEKRLLNLNVPPALAKYISRLSLSVKDLTLLPKIVSYYSRYSKGFYTIVDVGSEAISSTIKAQIDCQDSLDKKPVNVEINGRSNQNTEYMNKNYFGVYRVNEPNSTLKQKNPLIIKTMFGIYDDYCRPVGLAIEDLSPVTVLDYNINIKNTRFYNSSFETNPSISYKKPVSIAFNKTTYGTYIKNRKVVEVATVPWYGSVRTKDQAILNNQIGAPFAHSGYYEVSVRFGECRNVFGRLVRRYGHGTNGFSLINRHEKYNEKFEQFFGKNNPQKAIFLDNETKVHIRDRHDANFLTAFQFLRVYELKSSTIIPFQSTINTNTELIDLGKGTQNTGIYGVGRSQGKSKGSPFYIPYETFFKYVEEIANMTNVNDFWVASNKIEGIRNGLKMQVQFNKNDDYIITSAYPNEENQQEETLKSFYLLKTKDNLVKTFKDSLNFSISSGYMNYKENFVNDIKGMGKKMKDVKNNEYVLVVSDNNKSIFKFYNNNLSSNQ